MYTKLAVEFCSTNSCDQNVVGTCVVGAALTMGLATTYS